MTTESNSKKTKRRPENQEPSPKSQKQNPKKQERSEGVSPPSKSYGDIESTAKIIGQREGAQKFMNKILKEPGKLDDLMDKFMEMDMDKVMDNLGGGGVSPEDIKIMGEAIVNLDDRLRTVENNLVYLKGIIDDSKGQTEKDPDGDSDKIDSGMG